MRILYIDIDSLRADYLGCCGLQRNTSPNIDALAARGARIANLYTFDSPCLPSRTAFFGGRFGTQTGVVCWRADHSRWLRENGNAPRPADLAAY